jgi:hypothetical protein
MGLIILFAAVVLTDYEESSLFCSGEFCCPSEAVLFHNASYCVCQAANFALTLCSLNVSL